MSEPISPPTSSRDEEDALALFFSTDDPSTKDGSFSQEHFNEVSRLLKCLGKDSWSNVPRTYVVLRTINQLDIMDDFMAKSESDFSFPFSQKTIPEALKSPSARRRFLEVQGRVLSEKFDLLEKGSQGKHMGFRNSDHLPFHVGEMLGKGYYGEVHRITSKISLRTYARKRFLRGKTFQQDQKMLQVFVNELKALKKVSHKHITQLIGSYTDTKFVVIIMLPVADENLFSYMRNFPLDRARKSHVGGFFGCLATALAYLHDNDIRHKDIKPQNILIKDSQPVLADFGLALDWSEKSRSTTFSISTGFTPRYAAPEVINYQPRSSSSDVWSLGCVFLEMCTVMFEKPLEDLKAFQQQEGSQSDQFWNNADATKSWIENLRITADHLIFDIIQEMLQQNRKHRPSAIMLMNRLKVLRPTDKFNFAFCGACCEEDEDTEGSVYLSADEEVSQSLLPLTGSERGSPIIQAIQNEVDTKIPLQGSASTTIQNPLKTDITKDMQERKETPNLSNSPLHSPPSSGSTSARPPTSDSLLLNPPPSESTPSKPSTSDSLFHSPPPSGSTPSRPPTGDSLLHSPPPSRSTPPRPSTSDSLLHNPSPNGSTPLRPPIGDSSLSYPPPSGPIPSRPSIGDSSLSYPPPSGSTTSRPPVGDSSLSYPPPSGNHTIRPTTYNITTSDSASYDPRAMNSTPYHSALHYPGSIGPTPYDSASVILYHPGALSPTSYNHALYNPGPISPTPHDSASVIPYNPGAISPTSHSSASYNLDPSRPAAYNSASHNPGPSIPILHNITSYNTTDATNILLKSVLNPDRGRLRIALSNGAGDDLNQKYTFVTASRKVRKMAPLHWAVEGQYIGPVQLLLSKGADVERQNDRGLTALHVAAQHTSIESASNLLDNKANVNSRTFGRIQTPLHVAATSGSNDAMVLLLLSHGADINAMDVDEYTPLSYAVEFNRITIVEALLRNRALYDAASWNLSKIQTLARTAPNKKLRSMIEEEMDAILLFEAAHNGDEKQIKNFLAKATKPQLKDSKGGTPYRHVLSGTHTEVADSLSLHIDLEVG